jgi:enamine deaminase RidA (YjgF/YER057c/UK114 family)
MGIIEEKLKKMGITLPEVEKDPIGEYIPGVTVGNLVFTSGAGTEVKGMERFAGKVGNDLTLEEGKRAARQCVINLLSNLKHEIGDLDRVERIVRLIGYVNSAPGFTYQPKVINGASELLIELWGEKGRHARAALSVNELWADTPVECYLVVQLKD